MDLLPAIDIRNGRVVRLSQGSADRQTVYATDAHAQVQAFMAAGATWIHLVDLDRAFGTGDNAGLITRLIQDLGSAIRIQVSGGIRTVETVRAFRDLPVTRFVLGTVAVTDPGLVPVIRDEVGDERLAIGLDAREGMAAIRGWVERTEQPVGEVARRMIGYGVRTIVYTDVSRDGMLTGPDIAGALALQRLGARVIASGGIASLDDIRAVHQAGLDGAIVGRAIYEGKVRVEDAVAVCANPSRP